MPEFVKMLSDSFASTEDGGIEDVISIINQQPTINDYRLYEAAVVGGSTRP